LRRAFTTSGIPNGSSTRSRRWSVNGFSGSRLATLNDHDELRHDPMMAILAGKLAAGRKDCAPR
jgi:hypothetical protein